MTWTRSMAADGDQDMIVAESCILESLADRVMDGDTAAAAVFGDRLIELGRQSVGQVDLESLMGVLFGDELDEAAGRFAEHVLHFFEDKCPDDNRPRDAVAAKRAWIRGDIDDRELDAAREAALGAARAASWDAGEAAEGRWQIKELCRMIEGQ
mgnify:CR=1 FL=1